MNDTIRRFSYADAPTILDFHDSTAYMRGLMGPFGSGKSSGCVAELFQLGLDQAPSMSDGIRHSRHLVVRNTYRQLKDTTIRTVQDWLPPHFVGSWRQDDLTLIVSNYEGTHQEWVFRALDRPDQVENLLSAEYTDAWVNEAREMDFSIIKAIAGRINRYPSRDECGATRACIIMDTNPPDTSSWWYDNFEKKRRKDWAIFKQPGGRSGQAENRAHLAPDYYVRMADVMDEEEIRVYVDGEYGFIRSGKPVYEDYKDSVHCRPVTLNTNNKRLYRGWDFGLTPACILAQQDAGGQLRVWREVVSDRAGIEAFAGAVARFCASELGRGWTYEDIADPAGDVPTQVRLDESCFSVMQGMGIDVQPGIQDPTIRQESVRKGLTSMVEGNPLIIIDPACERLREGFMGKYHYRRILASDTTGARFNPKPEKNKWSHPHDALQYLCVELFGDLTRGYTSSDMLPPIAVNDYDPFQPRAASDHYDPFAFEANP